VLILGSLLTGRRTALEALLGASLTLPDRIWRNVNLSWGLFFLIVGLLNVYIAFYYRPELSEQVRTDFWVNFKVFGLMGLTLVFAMGQMLCIAKYLKPEHDENL
jgi:intracellular septation protein